MQRVQHITIYIHVIYASDQVILKHSIVVGLLFYVVGWSYMLCTRSHFGSPTGVISKSLQDICFVLLEG